MGDATLDLLLLDEIAMLLDDCDALPSRPQPDPSPGPPAPSHLHPIPFGSSDDPLLQPNGVESGGGGSTDSGKRKTKEPTSCQSSDAVVAEEDEDVKHDVTLGSEKQKQVKPDQKLNRSQREKARLAHLRLEASQLQRTLDTLQEATSNGNKSSPAPRPSLAASSVWGPLSKRQQKERDRAERENADLKRMVASQVRLIKTLERKLRQQLQTAAEERSCRRHFSMDVTSTEMEIFRQLLQSSNARISAFDQIFDAHNLNAPVHSNKRLSEAHVAYNDELGMHFNFVESIALPFDFVMTADTIWKHMTLGDTTPAHATQNTQIIEQTEGMLATVRVMVFEKTSCETTCTTIYSVYKRVVQEDHVRLVWECFAESKQDPQSDVILRQWMHTNWTKVLRSFSRDGSTTALVQSVARTNPPLVSSIFTSQRVAKQIRQQRQDLSAFADALIASYQQNVQSARKRIENELMDKALKSRVRSNGVRSS